MNRLIYPVSALAAVGMCLCLNATALAAPDAAASARRPLAIEDEAGRVVAGHHVFESWRAFHDSGLVHEHDFRCGTLTPAGAGTMPRGSASDCTYNFTNPAGEYDPSVVKYRIPVVVHVIRNSSGTSGNISEALVQSQIDILNEDFLALVGTNGDNGIDLQIEFYLATEDPSGNPTNGITYSNNTTWFNDGGSYYNSLAWDPDNYLNIYTNTASGALGYVPFLPQNGPVGANSDRVVCLWSAFGRNAPYGFPYNQGRTVTHEVGHYLGLFHVFDGCGTASAPGCYSSGDRICDTVPQSSPIGGCSTSTTCGSSSNNRRNYMDYSNDLCMWLFSSEQGRRMRCTLEHWRPNLYEIVGGDPIGACCDPCDGTCVSDLTETDCNATGGSWQGADTLCGSVNCKAIGACCDPSDGSCTPDQLESACNSLGGVWQGPCSPCSPALCPLPCPGNVNDDNQVDSDDFLAVLGGWGNCASPCPPYCAADVNEDCHVDSDDFLAVLGNWGPCPAP